MKKITFKVKCNHCGREFESPGSLATICGQCFDELRSKENALIDQARAEGEVEARTRYEVERIEGDRESN